MRLTKTTSHAIRILIECAGANGRLINTASIARSLDITPLHVLKIVHLLSIAGFVECVRGRNGGVRISRSAAAIRIGDVVRTIESTELGIAGAGRQAAGNRMLLESIFDDALDAFVSVLDQHTLADICGGSTGSTEQSPTGEPSTDFAKPTVAHD